MRWGVVPGSVEHLASIEPGVREDPKSGSRNRERRRKWKARLERYVVECAYTGESQAGHVTTLTAELILARVRPNLMVTLTFPVVTGEDRRRWEARSFMGKWLKARRYVAAFELHKSGKLHAHAVAEQEGVRRLSMMDAWTVETGGWARVEAVQEKAAAVAYIAKYIVKREQGELEFGEGVQGGWD